MGLKLPTHLAYQVEHGGCPLDEALATAVCEALESADQEFLALEYLRQLAELKHPGTVVKVVTAPRSEPLGEGWITLNPHA